MKHTENQFVITKKYSTELETKQKVYKEQTRTKKQIQWCLITNNGASQNTYFKELIQHVVILDDLFQEGEAS